MRNDGSRVITTILVPWDQRFQAAQDILGFPQVEYTGEVWFVSRKTPRAYSPFTVANLGLAPFLYATQILRVDPIGLPEAVAEFGQNPGLGDFPNSENPPDWLLARMQVMYETLYYDIVADGLMPQYQGGPDEASLQRYISPYVYPSGDSISVPVNTFKFVPVSPTVGTAVVPGVPPRYRVFHEWVLIWESVPKLAIGSLLINPAAATFTIDKSLGHVNSLPFPSSGPTQCPPGTLLLTACNPTPIRSPFGDRLFRVEFRFKYFNFGTDVNGNAIGHQHYVNNDNNYYEITTTGTTNFVNQTDGVSYYNWYDFNTMFRPTTGAS